MKKLSIFAALAIAALGFTACSDDADPVFNKPAEGSFKLNTPALADQTYSLTNDGAIILTCSQPDYGFVASVHYGIEMTLNNSVATPDIVTITPKNATSATITISAKDVAMGISQLNGVEEADDWAAVNAGTYPIYLRATAQIGDQGESYCVSNWITLKNVIADQITYEDVVPQPGFIYLVGNPEGWVGPDEQNAEHYEDWKLLEKQDEIGSEIYYGVFDMPAAPIFRFYFALTGWDGGDSWGTQVDDSPITYGAADWADGTFSSDIVNGKGSFSFPDFEGGEMTIIVNKKDAKVTFMEGNQL